MGQALSPAQPTLQGASGFSIEPMTRREALKISLAVISSGGLAHSQNAGMASRGVKPSRRGPASGIPFNAKFTNVSRTAGLHAPTIYGGISHSDYILESMGCGVAFIDYDNDGWQDLIVLTGRRLESTPADAVIRLYRNNRDGTFTDISEQSGLARSVWAMGITIGDYDNDGFDDIFIACYGQNMLFHNNGNGTFTDVTEKAGLLHEGTRYGSGCSWIDYDRDGKIDLFVANYMVFDRTTIPARGKDPNCNYRGVPVFCRQGGMAQEPFRLYRNNGDGTFTDVSEKSGLASVRPGYPLSVAAADFDNDGWPDIYVACDTSSSLLFRNNHDGTFSEVGLDKGVALSEDGQEQAGMGLGIGDFDNDGSLDILKTNFRDDTVSLYRNNGKGNFRDVTLRSGLGVETRYVGWGAGIVDLDNDGLADLFFTTGMVYPEVDELPDCPYKTPNLLFRNLGDGKFEELTGEAGSALIEPHSSRGLAFGDFDNDGDLDILIMNMNEPPTLLRNDMRGSNHWLKVRLIGKVSNRSAIGAQVVATYGTRKQAQAVMAQSSYLSVNDRRLHFGLGAETKASLDIRWPNGAEEKITDIPADRLVVIREGEGVVKTERFGSA